MAAKQGARASKSAEAPAPPRRLALTGATLVEIDPPRVRRGTVFIEGGAIAALGGAAAPAPDVDVLDCTGLVVMPGFVCAHTHLYSSLARGMPAPREAPVNFPQILERVWWKLDRALDAEAVEVSALVGAVEAARAGVTTLVDHHASPSCAEGSLDRVAGALGEVGLRGVLCYETSDRGGPDAARAGVRENDRFLTRLATERPPLLRGLVGAHAAFTLSDATAEALADVAMRHATGVHIHVAEDASDSLKDGGSTVAWLKQRGLLGPRALLAHGVHVDDRDLARLRETGARVVHNPRSNANNAVGYARPSRFGDQLLLGTDGIGADVRAEAHAAFLHARERRDPLDAVAALERNRAYAAWHFGVPLGIDPGAAADLVVLDYRAPTPLEPGNLGGHVLFGLPGAPVVHVIVGGELVLRDGRAVNVDEERLYARARETAARLWARMAAL
ncbi:MAG TPA: amidohydrolase family protein [Polyangia bacterium]|nr:amidohydrolase family protein [Polyangia bacterium]